ncbi:SMAD/FHA domain-containing protein [Meira miltonrushii]|uniref:SMAD/FHA domain-containing protein n=1 Tax=Meira miltonrushii TaxID=1280837 RepID=A0A316VEM9_9BASI|nr:SMAD/FHA domain-containing protein [Meira miltonrushii]PWN35538.1 SMAD/FHA domain-containing protein [Meira miltonrushii]
MSRQESGRDGIYGRYDDSKIDSSSRRSKWDEAPESKDKKDDYHKGERYERRRDNSRRDEGERDRYRDRRSTERSENDDRKYKDRDVRDNDRHNHKSSRRRSASPSTSNQFRRDREKERQAYDDKYGTSKEGSKDKDAPSEPSLEPDFGSSGLLAKESNSKNGVQLKYFEPPEARKPKKKWRLYVFKDGKEVDILHISRQSCYLIGRDSNVVDIPVDHQSISKQHAVIQFRSITERNEFGDEKRQTKPFLIDLDSANGSFVNKTELPPSRYYELRTGDTIKLGASQREYVLLAED